MYNDMYKEKKVVYYILSVQLPGKAAHFYVPSVQEVDRYRDELIRLCQENKIDPECIHSSGTVTYETPNYATPFDELETQFYGKLGIPRVIIQNGIKK